MKRNTKDRRNRSVIQWDADADSLRADKNLSNRKDRRSKKDVIAQSIMDWEDTIRHNQGVVS